ncbi:carboxylesterase [Flavobacterium rivuli WB 3.3-2 = DSM 21788]|uniref:Carboxylic ester hydrolase n=1 Tax=Flavobacterium rivuli WB 3.3-2 = DSM 21788 TaxID=1121895 RepID=A0A0A2M8P8_9FLAO|nr:carboxylesterase family protein [Flavobacterium rivuli]KGO88629.1 carboxylesterase [Flavobacterium rivuli WB 3.3-2 = DSM 21788]
MIKKYLVFAVVLQFSISAFAQKAPQTKVEQGMLEGITLTSGVATYRGVPFALPPVGKLRWAAPLPPTKWQGVRKADKFGNNPMQKAIFGDMSFRAENMSEDCLYLNVWTPAKTPAEKLPVLVYFYGGGFVAGDGSENRYDGEAMARKGVVVVTLNYRLGIFGFFAHPGLTQQSDKKASGNYGLLDQNAALLWVKKNIAAFGGNPDKITIAGESAGSISVYAQMASPLSKGLIAGAIGQSGAMINPTLDAIPLREGEANGVKFGSAISINDIEKLRAIPAQQLLDVAAKNNFNAKAVVDGYFLTKLPSDIFKAGDQSKVPLMVGWTSAEVPYQAFMQGQYPSPANYTKLVKEKFAERADEVLKLYPGKTEKEVIKSATALASDNFIVYSTWKWADEHKNTGQPTFVYEFSKPRPPMKEEMGDAKAGLAGGIIKGGDAKKEEPKMPEPLVGASHASDIEYVLGNLETNKVYAWTSEDYKVSELSLNYFANFIKTGNPNSGSLPDWPVSKQALDLNIMDLNIHPKFHKETNRARYLFLDSYYNSKK